MESNGNIVKRLRENRILNERTAYNEMDRDELIKLAKDNDQLAIQTLVNQHQDFLRRMTNKYVPEGTFDSDDILQIAQIAFWEAIRNWDMTGDFEAYAGMVIKRRLVDEYRKLQTDKTYANRITKSINALDDEGGEEITGEMNKDEFDSYISNTSHKSAEDVFLGTEGEKELLNYLKNELTDVERKVIRLYVEGYKMAKISEITGVKYKSCENALMRAKNKLRYYLTNMRESKNIRRALRESESIFTDDEKQILTRLLNQIDESMQESREINEAGDTKFMDQTLTIHINPQSTNLTDDEYSRLYDLSSDGLEIMPKRDEFPMPWDAGVFIENGFFVIDGDFGQQGSDRGWAKCGIPLDKVDKYIEISIYANDEEDSLDEIKQIFEAHNWDYV